MSVSSFNFVGLTEKYDKKFNVLESERKKIEGINKHQQPDSSTLLSVCGPSFNFVCLSVHEKREIIFFIFKNWRERKMKKLREK